MTDKQKIHLEKKEGINCPLKKIAKRDSRNGVMNPAT
jgi:hypothetical protein